MARYQNILAPAARVLMSILFLVAGIGKIPGRAGTAGFIASKGLPLPQLGAVIAIVVEVGGALALIAGGLLMMSTFGAGALSVDARRGLA